MTLERKHVAAAQAAVFVATGLWPIVSLRTFEAVTGPKREGWLVKTVGLLVAGIGAGLALAAARGRVSDEAALVGGLAATALAGVDVRYGTTRRISAVYLADAALEALFIAGWLWTARPRAPSLPDVERLRPILGS
jgi:hypothetical protein